MNEKSVGETTTSRPSLTLKKSPRELAGVAIGLGLTLIHLIRIPVTNISVNPARVTSQALLVVGWH